MDGRLHPRQLAAAVYGLYGESRCAPQARCRGRWPAKRARRACGLSLSRRGQRRLRPVRTHLCGYGALTLEAQHLPCSAGQLII